MQAILSRLHSYKCATLKVPSNTVTRSFLLSCDHFFTRLVKRKCRTGRNRGEIVSNLRAEGIEPNDFGVEFSFANRATRKSSNKAKTHLSNRIRGSGAVLVPHPDKAEKGGDDACLVLEHQGVFGIMDGVGGWADKGVDTATYSSTFAKKLAAAVLAGEKDPCRMITYAHAETRVRGSSTACVATVSPRDGLTLVCIGNLGDGGAIVVRGKKVVFTTAAQQHQFNCPFQLGCPRYYPETDSVDDVQRYDVSVSRGDVLIMGSDGLWDNVFLFEVARVCEELLMMEGSAQEIAESVAGKAFTNSKDEHYDSPFAQEAREKGYGVGRSERAEIDRLVGGKIDDIAVLVVIFDST